MPVRTRAKGMRFQIIEGGGGGRKPLRPTPVELTVRVPLAFRIALRRWAFDENLTMSQLIQRELRPPSKSQP
jgi:hypothetical protein